MKKILYTIGVMMMLSAIIQPLTTFGQSQYAGNDSDVPFSSARIFSKLTEKAKLNPNANWNESFGTTEEKDVGKNLYLLVYNKTKNQPTQKTNQNVAGKYGITENDLNRFLQGDYTKFLAGRPGLSQEEAVNKISEIQQIYKEEQEIQDLKATIAAATEPSEIFANGDTSDSGFDLINDLTIIQNLLFLKTEPITVGGNYVASAGANGTARVSSSSGNETATGTAVSNGGTGNAATGGIAITGNGGNGTDETSGTSSGTSGTSSDAGDDTTSAGTSGTSAWGSTKGSSTAANGEEKVNPISCFGDNKYQGAINDFIENVKEDDNYKDRAGSGSDTDTNGTSSGANGGASSGTSGTGSNTSGGGSVSGGSDGMGGSGTGVGGVSTGAGAASATENTSTPFTAIAEPQSGAVNPAPADKWLKDKLCAGNFCIFINQIKKPATSAYQNSDNCIACHAEKIDEILKKTISYSLVPSKAPGNLGEAAMCKKAMAASFSSISMNIYTMSMPVLTPMNDDLIFGSTIEEDWYNYCSVVAFPFSCRKDDLPKDVSSAGYSTPRTILDLASKREIVMSSDTATIADVTANIDTAVTGYSLEKNQGLQTYNMTKAADNDVQVYKPVKMEMDRMNYYFGNMRDLIHSLHEKVDGIPGMQACTELKNKKECQ